MTKLEQKIYDIIAVANGIKGSQIAYRLGIDRKLVNSSLKYSEELKELVEQDPVSFLWYINPLASDVKKSDDNKNLTYSPKKKESEKENSDSKKNESIDICVDLHSLDEALQDVANALDDFLGSLVINVEAESEIVTEESELDDSDSKNAEKADESPKEELNSLIGLGVVKREVAAITELAKIQRIRSLNGMKTVPVSLHLVFTGNPGTGKTTIARIIGKIYKEIGILTSGQLVEVDRSDLVAGYVGQTAIKTQEKIREAMGGVLFIDEAYTLVKDGLDFGQEAIDTILKAMEDYRDQFIVIVAGYRDKMDAFINSNPGLKSRFSKYIDFPDYSAEELKNIFDLLCRKYEYMLSDKAKSIVYEKIDDIVKNKGENFANAREIRNYFEAIITNQALRVGSLSAPKQKDLCTILPDDVEGV